MAEDKPLSTKDLFLLLVGLRKLDDPGPKSSPKKYYLKDDGSEGDGSLRDSSWNWDWLSSPAIELMKVLYPDWLMANIAANLTGGKQDFSAISEPVFVSLDLLAKEFKPNMPDASDAIKKMVVSKNGYDRSFLTTLTLGLSVQQSDGRDVVVFGAGLRRRTKVWQSDEAQALQADVEFFVPFYVFPTRDSSADDSLPNARSICAGISITRPGGSSIGPDSRKKDLAAARFNFRIPFTAQTSQGELVTKFGQPVIEAQKRIMSSEPAKWQEFDDWKSFAGKFCKDPDGSELLNAPIGPLLLETISDDSGIKDIILNSKKRDDIKEDLKKAKKELDEAVKLLRRLVTPEEDEGGGSGGPSGSSERQLGEMLVSLGLLEGGGGKYEPSDLDSLTVWDVANRMIDELDGFPLYLAGVDPKAHNGKRMAFTLAAQSDELDSNKHYFGLAGLAYNILLAAIPKGSPEAETSDPDATAIVLDEDNFDDAPNIWIFDDDDEDDIIILNEDGEEYDGPLIWEDDEAEETGEKGDKAKKKGTVELRLHLGKWFDDETLDDNWFRRLLPSPDSSEGSEWRRRVPLPGIRVMPFRRLHDKENNEAKFSFAPRIDLLSVGFDIKGTTKEGITFLQAKKGPFAYFGLGAIETRFAILMSAERVAFGAGIMFRNLRLSLGPKEEGDKKEKKDSGDDITGALEGLLADDWEMVPEPKKQDKKSLKTRLRAKKQDKFSISVGYLSPLKLGSHGTLDIQLYDKKGNPGKVVWIPLDRRLSAVYLKQIGIGLEGVENVELSEGLSDDAKLTVALTGGLRFPAFELGFIGAKLSFPLKNPLNMDFGLDGLDISLKMGSAVISGSFLKSGIEYAGLITIDLPKLSIGAMGFYGNLSFFDMDTDPDIIKDLRQRKVHSKLKKELKKNEIELAADHSVERLRYSGQWKITSKENIYLVRIDGGKLNVLSPDRTFFIYGMLNLANGSGINMGPIEFTGFALGGGVHRQVKVPSISEVADFPMVKLVMGKGGYQEEDESGSLVNQLGKPIKEPVKVLEKMKKWLPAKRDQFFACAGVRFTIAKTVDCFGLLIVQWGNEFELSLLGLARFRQPADPSANPICYVELQILMNIKPKEGYFKLEAMLTSNSWVLNKDCKLTGGFALYVWFDGKHKDDFVITLGGYHPRFKRPSHYPQVPRLGLNWPVNDNLSIKGNVYFAITPSCGMLGAKLEAVFHSGRISAWFTAYLDVIVNWSPLYLQLDMGVSLKIEASFFLTSISITISATIKMWGPPLGGLARIDISLLSFEIPFGVKREESTPKVIESWALFCRTFLRAGIEQKLTNDIVKASPMMQPNLSSGRSNLDNLQNAARKEVTQDAPDSEVWKVRGDQLELAASASVPVKTLNVGRVKTNSPVQDRSLSGQSLRVKAPLVLDTAGLHTKNFNNALGVRPMGKSLNSVLNVTIVRDDVSLTQPVDLADWTIEAETSSLPAALWDTEVPNLKAPPKPSAKLIPDCITGIKRLKPKGGDYGPEATRSGVSWSPLTPVRVPLSGASQQIPSATRSQNIQAAVAGKQAEQKRIADALSAAGFNLAWQPAQTEIRFRELQAEPMSGSVTTEAR